MINLNIEYNKIKGVDIIPKGRITFTVDDDVIEDFKIIAIKLKKSSSNLAEQCMKECIEKNKKLL